MGRESGNIRARNSSMLARPYIPRLSVFNRLIWFVGLAIAAAVSVSVIDGGEISPQRASKALDGVNPGLLGIIKPDLKTLSILAL
jgi:hypothetical protein